MQGGDVEVRLGAAVRPVVEQAMAVGRVPGIALAVARGGRPAELLALGADAVGRPLGEDTLFPVASISKLATALAVLRLVERGELGLDDPLARHLPDAAAARPGVSLRALLSHTGGLPARPAAGAAPHRDGPDWPALARACLATPPEAPPGTRVRYGNAGYGLLAIVVERLRGRPFGEALAGLVLEPLGIEAYLGVEPPRRPAAIGDVRGEGRGTPLEPLNSASWRSLGAPWAGLLTTPVGALGLLRAFRGVPAGFLRPETLAEATRNQVGGLGGGLFGPLVWPACPWGLGVELRGRKQPHWAPAEASPESFGHVGSSGCLVWADPAADVAWAILGARTYTSSWLLRYGPRIGAAILPAAVP